MATFLIFTWSDQNISNKINKSYLQHLKKYNKKWQNL